MEEIELKNNMARIGFACTADNYENCVYGKPIEYIPCGKCETYIKDKRPPFEDYCHACDRMYEWDNCEYLGCNNNCMSTVACVNKAVLFLKEVGITVEDLQSICSK